jgi:hypothetical protein
MDCQGWSKKDEGMSYIRKVVQAAITMVCVGIALWFVAGLGKLSVVAFGLIPVIAVVAGSVYATRRIEPRSVKVPVIAALVSGLVLTTLLHGGVPDSVDIVLVIAGAVVSAVAAFVGRPRLRANAPGA